MRRPCRNERLPVRWQWAPTKQTHRFGSFGRKSDLKIAVWKAVREEPKAQPKEQEIEEVPKPAKAALSEEERHWPKRLGFSAELGQELALAKSAEAWWMDPARRKMPPEAPQPERWPYTPRRTATSPGGSKSPGRVPVEGGRTPGAAGRLSGSLGCLRLSKVSLEHGTGRWPAASDAPHHRVADLRRRA